MATSPKYQGHLDKLRGAEARRDVKPWWQKKHEEWYKSKNLGSLTWGLLGGSAVGFLVAPVSTAIVLGAAVVAYNMYLRPNVAMAEAPFRMPKHANMLDGSRDLPGVKGRILEEHLEKLLGEGTIYLGFDQERKLQVWVANGDMTTHCLLLGTTGSGKTVAILALCANVLMQGGGYINIDAKGDIVFQQNAQRIARDLGREDDMLTISFGAMNKNIRDNNGFLSNPTNTFNLMSNASASAITELLISLMDGEEDVWKGRAVSFLTALIPVLCYRRDNWNANLSPETVVEYLDYQKLQKLVFEEAKERNDTLFTAACQGLKLYLEQLPGFTEGNRTNPGEKTLEQHGYITMQLTRSLGDLAYQYGHIFGVNTGEIAMTDVVYNRRILTGLLPALDRSIATLSMLGRLLVQTIKQMMALSLGNKMEGSTRLLVDARPTESRNIFLVVFDEVGFMMSEGMSIIPSQARSLKISTIFAGQSYVNLEKADPKEAEEIWDNTNLKMIGRLVSSSDQSTVKKLEGLFDEEYFPQLTGYHLDNGRMKANKTYDMRAMKPFKLADYSGQKDGEFTLISTKKSENGLSVTNMPIRLQFLFPHQGKPEPTNMFLHEFVPLNMEKYQDRSNATKTLKGSMLGFDEAGDPQSQIKGKSVREKMEELREEKDTELKEKSGPMDSFSSQLKGLQVAGVESNRLARFYRECEAHMQVLNSGLKEGFKFETQTEQSEQVRKQMQSWPLLMNLMLSKFLKGVEEQSLLNLTPTAKETNPNAFSFEANFRYEKKDMVVESPFWEYALDSIRHLHKQEYRLLDDRKAQAVFEANAYDEKGNLAKDVHMSSVPTTEITPNPEVVQVRIENVPSSNKPKGDLFGTEIEG